MSRAPRPLSAFLYVRRNLRRVLPLVVVQALVTALVLAVVTPLSGFEATAEASLRAARAFTAVTPAARGDFDADLLAVLDADPALERHVRAKALWIRMPMVVGEDATMLLALDAGEHEDVMRRVGNRLLEGTLPRTGTDDVAIHSDVAKARGLRIGDAFGSLVDREDLTPGRLHVVGIVGGPTRLGHADLAYASRPSFVLARVPPFEVVFARAGEKARSDAYLNAAKDSSGAEAFRVWDEAFFRRRIDRLFRNLPLILDAIVGAITAVITVVVVLLQAIAFQARTDEFALLLAAGRTRARLARKLLTETAIAAVAAWALGLALGFGFLAIYRRAVLEPKAILIRPFDTYAVGLASVLPAVAAAASAVVLWLRLRRMDPVAVVQRRNA